MVDVERVQVLEKHPEIHCKALRNASLSFPPPPTRSIRHMVVQELPSRLRRVRFSKLQASFKPKQVWRELTKELYSPQQ